MLKVWFLISYSSSKQILIPKHRALLQYLTKIGEGLRLIVNTGATKNKHTRI